MFSWFWSKKENKLPENIVVNVNPNPSTTKLVTEALEDDFHVMDNENEDSRQSGNLCQDELGLKQKRLQEISLLLDSQLRKWETIKIDIESEGKILAIDIHHEKKRKTLFQKIKEIFREIAALCESPGTYFKNMSEKIEPHLLELRKKLIELMLGYEQAKTANQREEIRLHICYTSTHLINVLQKMMNKIQGEVDYCSNFESMTDKAQNLLLEYLAFLTVGVTFKFNDDKYLKQFRNSLYDKTHKELDHIETFVTDALGDLKKAYKFIQKNRFEKTSSYYWTPDKNVRTAPDKVNDQPTPKRTASLSSF